VEARCTAATPSFDSITSATDPGRPAAGRCRPCARPGAGPGEKPPPQLPAAAAGPGAGRHRHRHWAAAAARWRCPARDYETRVGNPPPPPCPAAAASRCGAARAAGRAGPRGPLTLPHVAGCRVVTRAPRGAGSPDCVATAGPGAARPGVGGGGSAGAATSPVGPPRLMFTVWGRRSLCWAKSASHPPKPGRSTDLPGPSQRGCAPESGPRPLQSGRRWGTDGPAASTIRRTRTRRAGAGRLGLRLPRAADREPRTARARRREGPRRKGSCRGRLHLGRARSFAGRVRLGRTPKPPV
jgi:hypothetical protein